MATRFGDEKAKIFKQGNDFKTCPAPIKDHSGSGEEVVFIDPKADENGNCSCGLENSNIGLGIRINFNKNQLPALTNWQHWGRNEYVTGLEPGTHYPIGQKQTREEGSLIFLAPNESKVFEVGVEVNSKN